MTHEELLLRLKSGEDNLLERKPAGVADRDIRRTVVAFANSVSGTVPGLLLIGIHDRTGVVEGVADTDALQKRVRKALEDCFPSIDYSCLELPVAGKLVVAVIVPVSRKKPHFAGPAFIRQGSESCRASEEQFKRLLDTRTGKCAAILALVDQVVTVDSVGYMLGSHKPLAHQRSVESSECRVVDCTAELVTLHSLAQHTTISVPLPFVTVARDDKRHRAKLIVMFP